MRGGVHVRVLRESPRAEVAVASPRRDDVVRDGHRGDGAAVVQSEEASFAESTVVGGLPISTVRVSASGDEPPGALAVFRPPSSSQLLTRTAPEAVPITALGHWKSTRRM